MFQRRGAKVNPRRGNIFKNKAKKTETSVHEWIQLCISASIPLMIGIFTIVTTIQQQKLSTQQREQDKLDAFLLRQNSDRHADNLRKESVFATYLDDVSKLLMLENETKSLLYIRMKTLISLRQLDSERKSQLFLFLYENQLIHNDDKQTISSLLKLDGTDFSGIYFRGTKEARCSLEGLYLHDAYLSNSSFINCWLWFSNFAKSVIYNSMFCDTELRGSSFNLALLDKANFSGAYMTGVTFIGTSLIECDFTGARWSRGSVHYTNANLTGAILSNEQLRNSTLYNCVLPNGTWGPIRTENLVINGNFEQNCTTNGAMDVTDWIVSNEGEMKVIAYDNEDTTEQFGKCYFRVMSFFNSKIAVSASQVVDLNTFSLLISNGVAYFNASVNFRCSGNFYGYIEIYFVSSSGLRDAPFSNATDGEKKWQTLQLSNIIYSDVRSVLIRIVCAKTKSGNNGMNMTIEENFCVCDNVRFSIIKR